MVLEFQNTFIIAGRYIHNWTEEIILVKLVINTVPRTFVIED